MQRSQSYRRVPPRGSMIKLENYIRPRSPIFTTIATTSKLMFFLALQVTSLTGRDLFLKRLSRPLQHTLQLKEALLYFGEHVPSPRVPEFFTAWYRRCETWLWNALKHDYKNKRVLLSDCYCKAKSSHCTCKQVCDGVEITQPTGTWKHANAAIIF